MRHRDVASGDSAGISLSGPIGQHGSFGLVLSRVSGLRYFVDRWPLSANLRALSTLRTLSSSEELDQGQ